jgi:hypothetical protein
MVIAAKVTMTDLPHTEVALKQYMVGMQYPFGLLITPEKGWVYRDLYFSLSPESVKKGRRVRYQSDVARESSSGRL